MSRPRVLFVTGATGLVGGGTARRALERGFARVLALRRSEGGGGGPGVRFLRGDLRREGLGLSREDADLVARQTTHVLHAGADTRFNRSIDDVRATNAEGTREVLALAERCRRLERVLHVSTVHVAGLTEGRVPERALAPPTAFANTYQRSKHEAEALVLARRSTLPASIVRLSTLVGESADGRVLRPNYVHGLIRLLPLRLSPVAAVDLRATVDWIASDWALDAVHALLVSPAGLEPVHHVCAGPDQALSVESVGDDVAAAFEEHGAKDFRLPTPVTEGEYRAHVEALRLEGRRTAVRILEGLELFLPHLRIRQVYENERTIPRLEAAGLRLPPPRETFRRVLRWCLRTDFGARAALRGMKQPVTA